MALRPAMPEQRRVRILHVLEDLDTGGTEQQLAIYLLRSDVERFEHQVCLLCETGRFAEELRAAGVPIHVLWLRRNWDLLRAVIRLRRLVRRFAPDIIHARLYRPGLVSRTVGRLCGIPVVTTLVNMGYEPEWRVDDPHLRPWKVEIVRAMDSFTARRWDAQFVAVTEAVKQSAVRRLGIPAEKVTIVPRGLAFDAMIIPSPAAIERLKTELGCRDVYPVILNVGRLVPQKGQRYLIEAMRQVVEEFPKARLLVAGEGDLRDEFAAFIRSHGLEPSVQLLGDRTDVPILLAAADIFAFPSVVEGFGVALIEAMGYGKPCIASDIDSLREVSGGRTRALLVPSRSEDALAMAIVRLARDRGLAGRLGAAAALWARSRFDARRCARDLEAVYVQVLNGRGESP